MRISPAGRLRKTCPAHSWSAGWLFAALVLGPACAPLGAQYPGFQSATPQPIHHAARFIASDARTSTPDQEIRFRNDIAYRHEGAESAELDGRSSEFQLADDPTGIAWIEPFGSRQDLLIRLPEIDLAVNGTRPLTFAETVTRSWRSITADHSHYYSGETFAWLAVGFGGGALMANTKFDDHFVRHNYLRNVVNISNDDFYESIHQPHFLGDGRYTVPAFAVAALAEQLFPDAAASNYTGEWGRRSLRTVLVGTPPMLAAQMLTGASRPGETIVGSSWKPLSDSNGVSGHSFMGAIPFLSAAKMTEAQWVKAGLYLLSAAPALSRVNDDKHYFSQAFLGWWMAYAAAVAVDRSYRPDASFHWGVTQVGNGVGFGMSIQR